MRAHAGEFTGTNGRHMRNMIAPHKMTTNDAAHAPRRHFAARTESMNVCSCTAPAASSIGYKGAA